MLYSHPMTITTTPTIEIPRLDGETSRAYHARVQYVTMPAAQRSLDALARQIGYKTKGTPYSLMNWSRQYNWVEHARRYDDAVASLTVHRATSEYQQQLEQQRQQAFSLGTEMLDAARAMLADIMARRQQMDYRPGDLAIVAKVAMAGLEARSHALNIDRLMEAMEQQS